MRIQNKCIGGDTKAAARQSQTALKNKIKIKHGEKRFSIWRMECAMWHNHDIDFARWLHPAMWHVALEWWQWIHQVTAPYSVDDMPWNSPKRPPYWNSTYGFDFDHITAVDVSFCTSVRNFILIGPPSAEKMTSCRFSRWRISAILDFRGPVMGSLKSPCTTSYR